MHTYIDIYIFIGLTRESLFRKVYHCRERVSHLGRVVDQLAQRRPVHPTSSARKGRVNPISRSLARALFLALSLSLYIYIYVYIENNR